MIRAATFGDMPRLRELFYEMHGASCYAGKVGVDDAALRSIIMHSIKHASSPHNGGTIFLVAEKAGEVEGFMIGVLERVYYIGDRLRASDLFLYCTRQAPMRASHLMLRRYIAWAAENPKVHEIALSWTDAISPTAGTIEGTYSRLGFRKVGGIWMRELE